MKYNDIVIISERLRQESISMEFADDIFQEFTKKITKYMTPQPAKDILHTKKFITDSIQGMMEGSNLQLVILKGETGEFLGCSGLHDMDTLQPELGIWLKESAHGNSYGLEAIAAIINWANENISYDYIRYPVDRRNLASKRIPELLGGVVKNENKHENDAGFMLDIVEYWIA